jgi:CheY-like chemotaxis protein
LSIVREILHLHEGELEISSKISHSASEHHGSTFTARLPLKERRVAVNITNDTVFGNYGRGMIDEAMRWKRDGASSTEGSNSEVGVESTLGSQSHYSNGLMFEPDDTLLIIDDNGDMRDYVKSIFSPYCKVREASNGEMGRQMALENPPDLILTDVLMPKLSGMELLTSLRSEPPTRITPIVMLSAVAGDEARLDALMSGAEDYLTKPFKPKELLARVHLQMHVGKKRKQLEAMYSQRQTEMALLSDLCPSGIMRANPEGVLTYANDSWRRMAGMPPGSDPATWPDFVDEDNQGLIYPAWSRFLNGKETETRIGWKWKNGSVSSGNFIRLDLLIPGMKGVLGCINDVTHEEMRIVEAERRRIEAEESKHQQELLVDLTSHEIRTPVSAILQCSSLVKENLVALTEQLKLAGPMGFNPTKDLLDDMAEDIEALESGSSF